MASALGVRVAGEPAALAAGSANRRWLSGDNDLTASSDGGPRWDQVRGVNPQGSLTTFSVVDASHAWLVGLDSCLWRTANGVRWYRVGPLRTNWPERVGRAARPGVHPV